jgi:hypothetical protein
MITKTRLTLAGALLAASVGFANAQNPADRDTHHPDGQVAAPAQGPAMPPAQGPMTNAPAKPPGMGMGMGGQGGQGMTMGGDMAKMMAMMQMMHGGTMPMSMGPAGMRPLEHIEGQLAFYKTELKITDAQGPQWNAFAATIRDNATKLRQAMMQGMQANEAPKSTELIQRRIASLTVQLDAMKAVQATAKPLYDVLSSEQKKTADELMAQHFQAMRAGGM